MPDIKTFDGKTRTIIDLADAYYKSYVKLSANYKSKEEMALYKKGKFIKKLKNMSKDDESKVFVYYEQDKPLGFVRYSPVPSYYKNDAEPNQDIESGEIGEHSYFWQRKLDFSDKNPITDKTMVINQLYLDPSIQAKGVGTNILEQTLPLMKNEGYENFVIEYNANNTNAEKFYKNTLTLTEIAKTKDFDNIVTNPKTEICMSPVKIGFAKIDNAVNKIKLLKSNTYKRNGNDR